MIRESISFLRKKQFVVFDEDAYRDYDIASVDSSYDLDVEQLQALIDALPEGYKMVFVLYSVEGYKHQEIAEMLDISVNTSKSQLFKARRWLQKRLKEKNSLGYGTH
jgi:RNA polymerase sigma-70 factor (ECF subfamily)